MSQVRLARATLDDLSRTPGKAERLGSRIVHFVAAGRKPSRVAQRMYRRLDDCAPQNSQGEAHLDNLGYATPLPSGGKSLSAGASHCNGPLSPEPRHLIEGSPSSASELRSENDDTAAARASMADTRADDFAGGARVVWEVGSVAECIHVDLLSDPDQPTTYQRGGTAEMGPAVPQGRVAVDWLFEPHAR